jgi:hypothetical protein
MSPLRIVNPEMLDGVVALPLAKLKIRIFAPPLGWIASEPEPGPTIDTGPIMSGSGVDSPMTHPLIGQNWNTLKTIVSSALLDPATHSPAATPDAVLLFAAEIASRKVQLPSFACVSA